MKEVSTLFIFLILAAGLACEHKAIKPNEDIVVIENSVSEERNPAKQVGKVPKRPPLLLTDPQLVGQYQLLDKTIDCKDEGREICQEARIGKAQDGALAIVFARNNDYAMKLVQKKDILLFARDYSEDCDNPSCGNLISISGIVYFKRIANKWVRTIKVTTNVDFPYPQDPTEPEGLVTSSAHLIKK